MRAFAKGLALLICCTATLVALALWLMPDDLVELEYATYEQAAAAGAFTRQALPDKLPKSATVIYSMRDLDNGGEVVTFRYGPDFDQFIMAQVTAPPQTAKSLGIRLRDDRFANLNELTYLPRVAFYHEHEAGSLLINRAHRVALYID